MSKLYIGNLPFSVGKSELKGLVEQFGPTRSVRIISDRFSGRSQGYAFVEMANEKDVATVIDNLSGKSYKGRELAVSYARSTNEDTNPKVDHAEGLVDRFAQLLASN